MKNNMGTIMFVVYMILIISGINIFWQIYKLNKKEKVEKNSIVPSPNAIHILKMIKKGKITCQVGENHAEKFNTDKMIKNYKSAVMHENIGMIQTLDIKDLRLKEIYGTSDN